MADTNADTNQEDMRLVNEYRIWLLEQGLAEATARRYAYPVRQAVTETNGGMDALIRATADDLARMAEAWLRKSPIRHGLEIWCPAMRGFFDFLVYKGLRQDCPRLKPKVRKDLEEQAKAEGKKPASDYERLRDNVIFLLLTGTDLKPAELRVMTASCYRRKLGRLDAGPLRRVYLTEEIKRALDEYLDCPRDMDGVPAPLTAGSPLFADKAEGMLPEEHYWRIIRQALRLAEFERRLGAREGMAAEE